MKTPISIKTSCCAALLLAFSGHAIAQDKTDTENSSTPQASQAELSQNEANAHMWADLIARIDSPDHEFGVTPVSSNRVLFTRRSAEQTIIMETTKNPAGVWREPVPASFAVKEDADPFYDPYSGILYYMSRAAHDGKQEGADDYDIWQVTLEGDDWGTPEPLASGVNTPAQEVFPTIDQDGTLYFASNREGGFGGHDIYMAVKEGDRWHSENAGPVINSDASDSNPCVLPDGKTLIFYSGQSGGFGEVDLYRAKGGPGGWQTPVNLGNQVNSPDGDYAPGILDIGTFVYSQGHKLVALPMNRILR